MGLGERRVLQRLVRAPAVVVWSSCELEAWTVVGVVRVRDHERSRVSTYTTFVSSGRSRDVAVGTTGSRRGLGGRVPAVVTSDLPSCRLKPRAARRTGT